MHEHKIPLSELYGRVRSSSQGLSSAEAKKRLLEYGHNSLETQERWLLLKKFLHQFTNFFALLLLVAAALALWANKVSPNQGYFHIGIALLAVVLLNALFTFIQQYRSEKIMEQFRRMLPQKAEVLRDGKRKRIFVEEVVPGDILFISAGDKISADARLIEENTLKVDHSSITGEAEPQLRKVEWTHEDILESRNMVFSGTLALAGDGQALVYATGKYTEIGKIASLTKEVRRIETPLHKQLQHFVWHISTIAIVLGVVFFLAGIGLKQDLLHSLIFAIGIIVANVPEGLMPTVTLALSIASKRMARKNALVRNLESVETLGATTVICTDKTGTLTENKMSINSILVDLRERNTAEKLTTAEMLLSLKTMVLCNNARWEKKKWIGDPTETALMEFAQGYMDVQNVADKDKRLHEFPFDSKTRRMITINKAGDKKIAYIKGAVEVIAGKSTHYLLDGKVKPLTPAVRKQIEKTALSWASRGERVLGLAYKEVKSRNDEKIKGKNNEKTGKIVEENFVFLSLVGMIDPPRVGVPEAIQKCKSAGIKVIMVTGDHGVTAEALARKIGLLDGGKKGESSGSKKDRDRSKSSTVTIITGEQLDKMDEQRLKSVLKKENLIFARTNPIQKLRIVKALQAMGEVVTVTGDGVNDAPALKNADMGVAMGKSGTEVAREASDLVLMDDNFATIVNAVEEGRTIFDNLKKFITYILTSNVPEIIPFIAFALFNLPLAITVILILSIDLGTDLLPAIGLGSEKPEHDVMNKPPRSRREKLLTKWMLIRAYLLMGMIQAAAGFFAFFTVLSRGGWKWGQELATNNLLYMKAITAFFAAVVICQIANVLICRARREPLYKIGFFTNWLVWLGILVEVALLLLIVYWPALQPFLGTAPLTLKELLLGIPFALFMVVLDGVRKYLLRKRVRWVEKWGEW